MFKFFNVLGILFDRIYLVNEFFMRVNFMKVYEFLEYDMLIVIGKKMIVIGVGNIVMDVVCLVFRLGSEVIIVYCCGREDMMVCIEEIKYVEEEGVKFEFFF